MNLDEARDAFDANKAQETARNYFFAALDLWRDNALDDDVIEYIAFECGPYLVE